MGQNEKTSFGYVIKEIFRWVIIGFVFIFIYRFVREIIDPLLKISGMDETLRSILDLSLFAAVFQGIKKIQSIFLLILLSLLGIILLFGEKYLIKFIQEHVFKKR